MEINFDCEGAEGFTRVSGLTTPEGKRGRGKVEERNREGGEEGRRDGGEGERDIVYLHILYKQTCTRENLKARHTSKTENMHMAVAIAQVVEH